MKRCYLQMMMAGMIFFTITTVSYAQKAVVATAAADFSSGAHSVIDVKTGAARNNLLPTATSDITIAAYQDYFYRIERYQKDNITKFHINAPETPIWQFSTNDAGEQGSSNPYALIFLNSKLAVLLRYGKSKAWLVNPSATTQAEFKIGELDLSAYADSDGVPEMVSGVIVKGKVFIVLQRLNQKDGFSATNTAYIAVFDTNTALEINTGIANSDGVKGIPLPIRNPGSIQYMSHNDTIYVQGAGSYAASWSGKPAEYTGGIAGVNPNTYETAMLLDDGDSTNHPYGNISGMAMVSPESVYFVGYDGWGDNTLYSFKPAAGIVPVAALQHKNIAGMESGTYADLQGRLWICNGTDAEIVVLNIADNSVVTRTSTNLNPLKVVFMCIPGDLDGSGTVDLTDAIIGLKIVAGIAVSDVSSCADVNGDGKIGMEEVVYILQKVSGLR